MTPTLPSPDDDPVVTLTGHDEKALEEWLRVKPQPLALPQVDPRLTGLSALERSAEVLRYTAQRLEHWLSPQGVLREWVRRNVRLAVAIVVPLLIIAPDITWLFDKLEGWSASAVQIATNLAHMPMVTTTMLVSAVGALLYRWLQR